MKAFVRCGMGPCQGRLCGLTVTELIAECRGVPQQEVGYYRIRPPVKAGDGRRSRFARSSKELRDCDWSQQDFNRGHTPTATSRPVSIHQSPITHLLAWRSQEDQSPFTNHQSRIHERKDTQDRSARRGPLAGAMGRLLPLLRADAVRAKTRHTWARIMAAGAPIHGIVAERADDHVSA
jgi:hypothetical protein